MENLMTRNFPRHLVIGTLVWGLLGLGGPPVPQRFAAFVLLPPAQAQTGTGDKQQTDKQQADDTWQVIYLGDQRVGYSRTVTRTVADSNGGKIIRTENETRMTIKRFGQNLEMTTILKTDETEDGRMLGFEFEMHNPPAGSKQTVGRVGGGKLLLRSKEAGRTRTTTQDWDATVKSPAYQDRLLRESPLKPGDSRDFKTFLPEFNQVTTVKMVADDYRPVKLHDGTEKKLLKVVVTQSILPALATRTYLDESAESLRTEMDFAGMQMVTYQVPKEVAMQAIEGAELDVAVGTLVEVKPIRQAHKTRKAVYRITTPGLNPADYIVEDDTQQIKKVSDNVVELTVTALTPPVNARRFPQDDEYTASTQFLQANDHRVMEHARKAAAGTVDPGRMAVQMERYVYDKMKKKNFSTALASAAEVAQNLEGDCTEHAALLAAMLRAQRIPSRIAVGLVYAEPFSSFGGHMWTEAWLGDKWVPLDATLGQGGIGAAHIKLAHSSFADDGPVPVSAFLPLLEVLGNLKIEVVKTE
jgi:hypothetical protein